MVTLKDFKIGADYKAIRKQYIKECCGEKEVITISEFPSFCMTAYREAKDDRTEEKLYFLCDDNAIIIDITEKKENAYNHAVAFSNLLEIAANN